MAQTNNNSKKPNLGEELEKRKNLYKQEIGTYVDKLSQEKHGELVNLLLTKEGEVGSKKYNEDHFKKYLRKEQRQKIRDIKNIELKSPGVRIFNDIKKGHLNMEIVDFVMRFLLKKQATQFLIDLYLYIKEKQVKDLMSELETRDIEDKDFEEKRKEYEDKLAEYEFLMNHFLPIMKAYTDLQFSDIFPDIAENINKI